MSNFSFEFDFSFSENMMVLLSGECFITAEKDFDERGDKYWSFDISMEKIGYQCYLPDGKMSEYFGMTDSWDNCPAETREKIESAIIEDFKREEE